MQVIKEEEDKLSKESYLSKQSDDFTRMKNMESYIEKNYESPDRFKIK
jgi:hypothetical protein